MVIINDEKPVISFHVKAFEHAGPRSYVYSLGQNSGFEPVSEKNVQFKIRFDYWRFIEYYGKVNWDVELRRITPARRHQVVYSTSITLGQPSGEPGKNFTTTILLPATLNKPEEQFEIYAQPFIEIPAGLGTLEEKKKLDPKFEIFALTQGMKSIKGGFKLAYQPINIVYCPPGQDMTASLKQSKNNSTRQTIGYSKNLSSHSFLKNEAGFFGLTVGAQLDDIESIGSGYSRGIEISSSTETTIIADNQKAIGRAYWGPLGDIFQIMVEPDYEVFEGVVDGKFYYTLKKIKEVILIPAHKLLRPGKDPIASSIPDEARRQILSLDPFIHNLEYFFPENNDVPLSLAVNIYVDPALNGRGELIGRWQMDNGTELIYSEEKGISLTSKETLEQAYETSVTVYGGFTVPGISALIGGSSTVGNTSKTSVSYQSSSETRNGKSISASCHLIKNQNDKDLDGIEVYYDKMFSSLMFRKIRAYPTIKGKAYLRQPVVSTDSVRLVSVVGKRKIESSLKLLSSNPVRYEYEYSFYDVKEGKYKITIGNITKEVTVKREHVTKTPLVVDFIEQMPVMTRYLPNLTFSEAERMFPEGNISKLSENIDNIYDVKDLAASLELKMNQVKSVTKKIKVNWPETPLDKIGSIPRSDIIKLKKAGIMSTRKFFFKIKTDAQIKKWAKITKVSESKLRKIASEIKVKKASVSLPGNT